MRDTKGMQVSTFQKKMRFFRSEKSALSLIEYSKKQINGTNDPCMEESATYLLL